jgi:hypothetical protein
MITREQRELFSKIVKLVSGHPLTTDEEHDINVLIVEGLVRWDHKTNRVHATAPARIAYYIAKEEP